MNSAMLKHRGILAVSAVIVVAAIAVGWLIYSSFVPSSSACFRISRMKRRSEMAIIVDKCTVVTLKVPVVSYV